VSRERPNTDHSFFHEIIDDIRRLFSSDLRFLEQF
jgi:hypothetical protein